MIRGLAQSEQHNKCPNECRGAALFNGRQGLNYPIPKRDLVLRAHCYDSRSLAARVSLETSEQCFWHGAVPMGIDRAGGSDDGQRNIYRVVECPG